MKILYAASEMFPYVKTGGLADVCGSLVKSLAGLGHEVAIFVPGYRKLREAPDFSRAKLKVVVQVELGDDFLRGEVYALSLGRRKTLYAICRDEFFDRSQPYGVNGRDYDDNDQRFIFFSKAVVMAMRALDLKADIFHCHDWQTSLTPLFLRLAERDSGVSMALKTFFTIHNLAFQGVFPARSFRYTNLPAAFNGIDGLEFHQQISLIKGGIFFADKILTVSPTYAREILTPKFGCGLDGALRARAEDLTGIANGIDTDIWNPNADESLPARYSARNLSGKRACRAALLEKFGLPPTEGPVYGMICRLTQQKGLDLLLSELDFFARNECRLVALGSGEPAYRRALQRWARAHPERLGLAGQLDEGLSHLIEGGSDFFLMPSVFEPCGLNQMYSQRYGTIPLASKVGGLVDTVVDIDEKPEEGVGICFEPTAPAFRKALERSLRLYADPKALRAVAKRGMKRDFSWSRVARQYEELYRASV